MDEQTFDAIMADIADGQPMRQAAENAGVSRRAAWYAINSCDEWLHKYARAKDSMIEAMSDDMLAIADARETDVMVTEDGQRVIDNEAVQRARLRVDSRKWLLSKLAPKRYGDRLELAGDADAPLHLHITPNESKY